MHLIPNVCDLPIGTSHVGIYVQRRDGVCGLAGYINIGSLQRRDLWVRVAAHMAGTRPGTPHAFVAGESVLFPHSFLLDGSGRAQIQTDPKPALCLDDLLRVEAGLPPHFQWAAVYTGPFGPPCAGSRICVAMDTRGVRLDSPTTILREVVEQYCVLPDATYDVVAGKSWAAIPFSFPIGGLDALRRDIDLFPMPELHG